LARTLSDVASSKQPVFAEHQPRKTRFERSTEMKLSQLMIIKAVVCILFGLGMLLIPNTLMPLYDISLTDGGIAMTRLLGAAFILLAVMLTQARTDPGSVALSAIVLAVFVGDTLGFVVSLIGQLTGAIGPLGWTTVVLYFLLALGFGYFLFKPSTS